MYVNNLEAELAGNDISGVNIGWLVGWLVVSELNGPLRQYFSLYRAVS